MATIDFESECWSDPWFQARSPLGRYLFIYLWTNDHRNIAGLYVITLKTIGDETGLSLKQIQILLEELSPKIKYDSARSICWVVKHVRRQFLKRASISEQVKKGIRKYAMKLCYHPFFLEFIDQYPEIFDSHEKETLYRPSTDYLIGQSIDYPGKGKGNSFKEEIGVQREEEKEGKEGKEGKPDQATKQPNSEIKKFIDFYFEQFKDKFGKKPVIEGKKDGALIKKLLEEIPEVELKNLLLKFFKSTDSFILQSGYTIGVFKSVINKLIIEDENHGKPPTDVVSRRLWELEQDERRRSEAAQKNS